MKYTNIIEKLLCLMNLTKNSWCNLAFLLIAIALLILFVMKKISKKKCFCFIFLSYILLLSVTIYMNLSQLGIVADNLSDHFFTGLYFPSVYVYLFVLIMTNLVTLGSFLKKREEKSYRTIHGICFIAMNFIFTLILEIISKNKIDVFSKASLFSNTDLVTLLEMSVNIFILWIISLEITSVTNFITNKIIVRKEFKKAPDLNGILTSELSVNNNQLEDEYLSQGQNNTFIPDYTNNQTSSSIEPLTTYQFIPQMGSNNPMTQSNVSNINSQLSVENAYMGTNNQTTFQNNNSNYSYVNTMNNSNNYNQSTNFYTPKTYPVNKNQDITLDQSFDLSSFIPKKQQPTPIASLNNEQIFNQILRNELPVIKNEQNISSTIEQEKNTYTLNDYRIFNKILKDIREHNQNNTIQIDKNLEYRLITKYSNETYDMFKKMLKNYSN